MKKPRFLEKLGFYVLKHKLSDMMESNALALVASHFVTPKAEALDSKKLSS